MFVPLNDAFASFVIIFFCAVNLNLSVRYCVRSYITLLKLGNAIECAQSLLNFVRRMQQKQHSAHFQEEASECDLMRAKVDRFTCGCRNINPRGRYDMSKNNLMV